MSAAVFYATREGQSQRVVERVAADVINVKDHHAPIEWDTYGLAFVVASVHKGHHENELMYSKYNFVKKLVMKSHIRRASTATCPMNYEFTNWPEVDRFVLEAI